VQFDVTPTVPTSAPTNVPTIIQPTPTMQAAPQVALQPAPPVIVEPSLPSQAEQYRNTIIQAAQRYSVDPKLIGSIMAVESNGDPNAISISGAIGLMQVMPAETGYPSRPGRASLFDTTLNINTGVGILAGCIKSANGDLWSITGAVARYYGLNKPLTGEYIRRVKAVYVTL